MSCRNQKLTKTKSRIVRNGLIRLEVNQAIQLSFGEQTEAHENFAKFLSTSKLLGNCLINLLVGYMP